MYIRLLPISIALEALNGGKETTAGALPGHPIDHVGDVQHQGGHYPLVHLELGTKPNTKYSYFGVKLVKIGLD